MSARRIALAAAGLLTALALAGCGLPGGGATPGGGETGDNGAATSGPAPEGDGGAEAGTEVPATFPEEIPLIDGDVEEAADLGTGWVVLFSVADAGASFTEAADALVGAGFTEDARTLDDTQGFGQFTTDAYTVQLSSNVDYPGYGPAVAYTVVTKG